ncbi:MAG: histidine phosphatase family protein [Holophagaceae bacterium]|nr:histidine phosphatase family protein [Holophagaceae bacterium]
MRILLVLILSLVSGSTAGLMGADTVVVVVRHAEKEADDPKDPNLSLTGQARATSLAKVLADCPLTRVLVSEYRRTLQTAEPTLRAHNLPVTTIPIRQDRAEAYAQRLASLIKRDHQGEVILVVSHSNTVPAFVLALTGVQVPPIVDASEFNRLYAITLPAQGRPRLIAASY